MTLQFELTMPNVGSWNGIDTGKKDSFFVHRNVDKKTADRLDGKSFYYDFGDGWGANVKVTKHRKQKSAGFRGYEWMVDEILGYGKIIEVHHRIMRNKFEKEFKEKMEEFFKSPEYLRTDAKYLTQNIGKIVQHFNFMLVNNS